MRRSEIVMRLGRKFPKLFRCVFTLCLQGYLPLCIYDHWTSRALGRDLWPNDRFWIGRKARLLNGMIMEVHPADLIGRDIMETGCYEPETVDFVQAFLKPGMTFFDIGANIGQYSLLGSGLVGPNGVVHAFEPDPLVCDVLQRNLRLNGCDNVVPNRAAVARQDGTQALCLSISDGLGTTSLSPSLYDSGLREQVKTVCLDSYARSRSLPRVDLMKLDIEGAELQALQGAEMVLREYPDVVLILEFCELNARRFGHSVPELAAYLRDRGFQLFKIMPGGIQAYTGKDPDLPDNKYDNVIAARRPELLPAGNGHQPKR